MFGHLMVPNFNLEVPQSIINLIRSGLFQTANDPGGGLSLRSRKLTISYMCILPGVLGMFQLEF